MSRIEDFDAMMDKLDGMEPADLDTVIGRAFAMAPWQGAPPGSLATDPLAPPRKDVDGFKMTTTGEYDYAGFDKLQDYCWLKFNRNPFVFTTVKDNTGRMAGYGFDQGSLSPRVSDFIKRVWTDPRNGLISNFDKYIARSQIQGELFLAFTIHEDGFVEIDFMSPTVIKGFDNNSGILTATGKPLFPLMYCIQESSSLGTSSLKKKFIPSINLAYYPEMWEQVKQNKNFQMKNLLNTSTKKAFKKYQGCQTFMVQWDQSFVTTRNVGSVKVALEWIEHYDNIKKWELDHKKSSGAYLWSVEVEDRSAFRLWLAMTDEERQQTGLMSTKTPGGTVMLPPGFKLTCHNPKLSSITNQDDDILQLISAGLNTPEDVMTGSSKGTTFSGTKMSRGPVGDRIQDQVASLERFMIHGFWRAALWLNNEMTNGNWEVKINEAYKFEDGEAKFKKVVYQLHETVEISFPVSEMGDLEGKTRALLGVKHGSIVETLGVSRRDVARKLGFQNYNKSRLMYATEEEMYPELPLTAMIETAQAMQGEVGAEPATTAQSTAATEPKETKTNQATTTNKNNDDA